MNSRQLRWAARNVSPQTTRNRPLINPLTGFSRIGAGALAWRRAEGAC
jgi:hypothetical protein